MADVPVTARHVNPLVGAITLRYTAGGAGNVGDLVYQASDFDVEVADADALASSQAIGMVVGVGIDGKTTFVAGDELDVCVWGPVDLGNDAGMSRGKCYTSTTAGAFDQTAPAASGDYPYIVGEAKSQRILFIRPESTIPTVNP